jgi:hypothetical protein
VHPGARQKHFFAVPTLQFRLTHRVTSSINGKPQPASGSASLHVITEIFRFIPSAFGSAQLRMNGRHALAEGVIHNFGG